MSKNVFTEMSGKFSGNEQFQSSLFVWQDLIVGAGKRAEGGIYGPRIRFPREQFVKTI